MAIGKKEASIPQLKSSTHNNPPAVVLELTKEEAEFLLDNCDTNIRMSLGMLTKVSQSTGERLIKLIERFKSIRKKLRNQGVEI